MNTLNLESFKVLETKDLINCEGGFVLTGSLVAAGIGIFGGGIATGYAIGKIGKKIFGK